MISKRLKAKGLRSEENVEMWKCTCEQIKSMKQSWATINLQQLRLKPFQFFADSREECSTEASIDDPVIITHGEVHHVSDAD